MMHASLRPFLFVLALLAPVTHAAVRPTESAAPANRMIRLEPVASGLSQPLDIAHAGDGSKRLFVVEKTGAVKIIQNGTVVATPFLDLSALVSRGDEQGLLGIAFHPRYRDNGQFFVNYTDTSGNTVIARYRVSASNANVADAASAQVMLTVPQPFANHNGGKLAFGPDGYLYIGLGDGGSADDPGNRAQNRAELLGKMLRIDVDRTTPTQAGCPTGKPYAIPTDNPFATNPCGADPRPEIWAWGLRNPWRYSFDRATGDLYIGDVGQGAWEEVHFQAAGRPALDYGWKLCEGDHPLGVANAATPCAHIHTRPIAEYDRGAAGGRSITGGYVYRGYREPLLQGIYFFGDFVSGKLWGMRAGAAPDRVSLLLDDVSALASFGEDEDGELYVARLNGSVARIAATGSVGPLSSFEGVWWNAAENGHGVSVTQNGDKLFIAWYLYGRDGQPSWVVMPSGTWNAARTEYSGQLYTPSGAPYFAYDATRLDTRAPIGAALIRFDAGDAATLAFVVTDASGAAPGIKQLTRFQFGPRATGAPPPADVTGLWWGGTTQDGWGVSLTQQHASVFAAWYTYDENGRAVWFVMPAGVWNGNRVTGRIFRATGSWVLGAVYNPALFVPADVGEGAFTFTNPGAATFNYTVQGRSGSMSITRLAF